MCQLHLLIHIDLSHLEGVSVFLGDLVEPAECRPASLRNKPKPYLKVHLRYHLSVEEINDTVSKTGIMLRVGHHHNGGAFLMQLGK